MIVVSELKGQLGNRLFLSAYGIALAEATGQRFVNLALYQYEHHFPATRPAIRFKPLRFLARKLVRALILFHRHLPVIRHSFVTLNRENSTEFSPDNPSFQAAVKRRRLTIIEGWPDPAKLVFPTTDTIRMTFTPGADVLKQADDRARLARGEADVLVGVHIRHGDYKEYRGGIFYYAPEIYQRTMARMIALLPSRRVAFLVCSNGPQNPETFAPLTVTMGPGTLLGDLYSLARCDYLLGPPSTYSLWAAFYGRKPLHQMIEPEPPPDLAAFMIPDGHFGCHDLKLGDPQIEAGRRLRALSKND